MLFPEYFLTLQDMSQSLLLLLAHPNIANSKANNALVNAVKDIPGVTFRHLEAHKKNGLFDLQKETDLLRNAAIIIWQFPLYWYSCPSALRDWQDQVLSPIVYGPDNFLKGKRVQVVFTAGARQTAFRAGDILGFTPDEMLRPLQMTTNAALMQWLPPFTVFGAGEMSAEALEKTCAEYRALVLGLSQG